MTITFYQGFGLTIGSELYLAVNHNAARNMDLIALDESEMAHGSVLALQAPANINVMPWTGSYSFLDVRGPDSHIFKGELVFHE